MLSYSSKGDKMTTWDIDMVINKIKDSDKLSFVIESAGGYVYDWGKTGDYVYVPIDVMKAKKDMLTGKELKLKIKRSFKEKK